MWGVGTKFLHIWPSGSFNFIFEGILHNFYQLRVAEVKQTTNQQEGEVDDQATRTQFLIKTTFWGDL